MFTIVMHTSPAGEHPAFLLRDYKEGDVCTPEHHVAFPTPEPSAVAAGEEMICCSCGVRKGFYWLGANIVGNSITSSPPSASQLSAVGTCYGAV